MKKIVLVNVFIGDFPWFFEYFIKSCSYNPTIDFYIFCDKSYNKMLPHNVKLFYLTLEQFNILASSKLDLKISIKKAYKLCDFKPAYGVIFSEYLYDYDFWGICDIDVIFGQIREFMTDAVLLEHDVISVRADFPTGYFMLFKNKSVINNLFTRSKDYKMIFQSQKHFCFDECNFKHEYMSNGYDIFEITCEIESMHHVLIREGNKISVFWDTLIIEGHPGNLIWDEGQLIFMNKYEILLYHLKIFKSNKYSNKKYPKTISERFKIHSYHIQNQSFNAFMILWNYCKYELIKPVLNRLINRLDFFISMKLKRPAQLKSSKESVFSNGYIFLKKQEEIYFIANNKEFKNYNQLVPSFFKKQVFYTKVKYFNEYHIIYESSKRNIEDYKTVNLIGNIFNYKLRKL
jgi:hypothetical protein